MTDRAVISQLSQLLEAAADLGPEEGAARLAPLLARSATARDLVRLELALRQVRPLPPPAQARSTDGTECPSSGELSAFGQGLLSGGERKAILRHLVSCADCQWLVASLRQDLGARELPAWVANALGRAQSRAAGRTAAWRGAWVGALATAAVVVALGLWAAVQYGGRESTSLTVAHNAGQGAAAEGPSGQSPIAESDTGGGTAASGTQAKTTPPEGRPETPPAGSRTRTARRASPHQRGTPASGEVSRSPSRPTTRPLAAGAPVLAVGEDGEIRPPRTDGGLRPPEGGVLRRLPEPGSPIFGETTTKTGGPETP